MDAIAIEALMIKLEPQVIVLAARGSGTNGVSTDFIIDTLVHQNRGMMKRHAPSQRVVVGIGDGLDDVGEAGVFVEVLHVGAHDMVFGVRPQIGNLLGEALGRAGVVAVHPRDELAGGVLQTMVEAEGELRIDLVAQEEDLLRKTALVLAGDLVGVVRGGVVAEDQLPVVVGLVEDRVNCLREILGAIVDRHDDGDLSGSHRKRNRWRQRSCGIAGHAAHAGQFLI